MNKDLEATKTAYERLQREYNDLRNFACNLCGKYKYEHEGACRGCRWQKKEGGNEIERLQESQRWIPVNERLPEPEKRVLVCAERRLGDKIYRHIAMAMYEDGTVWTRDSGWGFHDLDNYETYDEKQDDWRIPEGWWEYSIYNEEGNCPVGDLVTHWMPLPEPPEKGAEHEI